MFKACVMDPNGILFFTSQVALDADICLDEARAFVKSANVPCKIQLWTVDKWKYLSDVRVDAPENTTHLVYKHDGYASIYTESGEFVCSIKSGHVGATTNDEHCVLRSTQEADALAKAIVERFNSYADHRL